jgi:Lrp/AsnC family leucine-responsive transcriptional regulator
MLLDAIDQRILYRLQENGQLSNQDLAEQVALSPSACLRLPGGTGRRQAGL